MRVIHGFFLFVATMLASCNRESDTLFRLLDPDDSNITFNNIINENDTFNILTHEYIYNGGGVGIADFNNDGLQDIFFTGNLVPNKLYLNKGDLTFEDVSEKAGIAVSGRWSSGMSIADVNNDGLLDIYVCTTMHPDPAHRRNMLFINNGADKKGIPSFTDKANAYGLEVGNYSVTSAFFDYDRDDDLDLYVLVNQRLTGIPTNYRPKITDGSAPNNDRLFRNNGNGTFTDVTVSAGITYEGFGLGLSISDLNLDGWPDIYVSNDYLSNDLLYMNNGDGTFTNRIAEFIGHQSQFSMGNDAADINNDGLPDLITVDMLPETHLRKKTTIGNKSYLNYINNEKFHYEYQYVRNMLHLNNGAHAGIKFSEIGQLAGVHQTEWSWSPLFADFDNDGFKDLAITNGFPKDITDKDFANYRAEVGNIASIGLLEDSIPVVKIPNYIFKNNGDLTFKDVTSEWGLGQLTFSNGAAFADLDNDGDLDYVVNNINSVASIYENTLNNNGKQRDKQPSFLRVRLVDPAGKKSGIGARARIYSGGRTQYYENNIFRGFLSSVENIIHFGIGESSTVDSLIVQWSDGNIQKITDPDINQTLTITYEPGIPDKLLVAIPKKPQPLFIESQSPGYMHQEEDKIDFNVQRTLPHKFTQSGPGMAVGDVDGDGIDDVVVGGSTGYQFSVFIQDAEGNLLLKQGAPDGTEKLQEDMGLLLFDADGDRDEDLYVVSGGMEHFKALENYQDRLYLNDGAGNFSLAIDALPPILSSGSCVRAADFDTDGDLDLFVGGRVVPGAYPTAPESFLLQNDGGIFKNVAAKFCPELKEAGMVTDALWTDFDGDLKTDLVIVGEYTPIMFFKNYGSEFRRVATAIDNRKGWWNSITSGDYDLDGDIDYVVGNLGLNNCYQANSEYPLKAFAKDFDGNGSVDALIACYMRESMSSEGKKLYPFHFWDELNTQSPKFRNKFSRYRQFGNTTMDELLDDEDRSGALVLEANEMASVFVVNEGNMNFRIRELPINAQFAPINGLITEDVNGDGFPDVMMVGNDYGNEVFAGRYDAFTGLVLLNDGAGNLRDLPSAQSGFYVPGDAKALVTLARRTGVQFVASQNRDSLKLFRFAKPVKDLFLAGKDDVAADVEYRDGRVRRVEFYRGSGYLSQSSRVLTLNGEIVRVTVYNDLGQSRAISGKDF